MKRRLLALGAAAALFGAAPAVAPMGGHSALSPAPAFAKSCSSGWTHATINGAQKCLRRGQFCAGGSDSQYHRYGFHCHKRDARGNYHLT